MRNTMRTLTQKMMVGVALLGGVLGAGTVAANAAPIEFHERFEAGYIPPCPGDGYVWTAGYYNGGYWVPGAWIFRGGRGFNRGYGYYGGGYHYDNDRRFGYRDRDDRRFEGRRDDGRRFEARDGYRGGDRGDHRDFHGRR